MKCCWAVILAIVLIFCACCSSSTLVMPAEEHTTIEETPIPRSEENPPVESTPAIIEKAQTTALPEATPKESGTQETTCWTMTELVKDWLITPTDLVIVKDEIYISGNLDKRIAVLNFEGKILRYYEVEKNKEFDNVCVGVTSQGQVLAVSSRGVFELRPDGEVEKAVDFSWNIDHMTIGSDDGIYVSHKYQGQTQIARIDLNGTINNITIVGSSRVSDLEFDANGDLLMADGQHGQILKYSQERGVEIFIGGLSKPNGDPFYFTFDQRGLMYCSSNRYKLASVSQDGSITPLGIDTSGDLFFYKGSLYALNIYTSTLYELKIDNMTVHTKLELLEGLVPWYINHQGEVIVGMRWALSKRKFYNYYLDDPVRIEPNKLLDELQPEQYTFDNQGNIYVISGNIFFCIFTPN